MFVGPLSQKFNIYTLFLFIIKVLMFLLNFCPKYLKMAVFFQKREMN